MRRRRTIGDRNFELRDATWVDSRYEDDMTLLRLRAGSRALARVLQAHPGLAEAVSLGKRVIVVVGDVAVLIAPDGFDDYPEAVLQRLLHG